MSRGGYRLYHSSSLSPNPHIMGLQGFSTNLSPRREDATNKKHNRFFSTVKSILKPNPDRDMLYEPPRAYTHRRKSHPIHNLPYELLALVFILASEDDSMLSVRVSHTCRAWRAIAIHTPWLWTTIGIDQRERMWAMRLARAKSCPLDIRMRNPPPGSSLLYADNVQRRIYFVLPYMHRWKSLDVMFTKYAPFLWNAALSECCSVWARSRAPMLEELRLIHPHNDDSKEFLLFGGHAPNLRRLTIDGIHLLWHPSLFHNLTHLDYTHHGFSSSIHAVEDAIYLLHVSCHLRELTLMFRQKHSPSTPSSHPRVSVRRRIRLPLLTSLSFRVATLDIPPELRHIASLLRTPSLESLSFIDIHKRRSSYPSTRLFFKHYTLPNTLQSIRRDVGWREPPSTCSCCEPHVHSACPPHDSHVLA